MKQWPAPKDPQEVKDYGVNWEPLLGSMNDDDTILTSEWVVDDDETLTIDSDTISDDLQSTTVWLSGGTLGTARVTNTVTTSGGRTYEQTTKLRIREK